MRAKTVFYCLLPILLCLGVFVGDMITARWTPKARASPMQPCLTVSASSLRWNDPNFPVRNRFIKFRTTGTCGDTAGYGCVWTMYQTIWIQSAVGFVKVFEGKIDKGWECGESASVQWTDDFVQWGTGIYRVDIDVYDAIPILNPTHIKHEEFMVGIWY